MLKPLIRGTLLVAGASTLACHSRVHSPYRLDPMARGEAVDLKSAVDQFRSIAKDLDAIGYDVEEYGTISASAPVLLLAPSASFKFDLGLTPREIFDRRMKSEASSSLGLIDATEISVSMALRQLSGANSAGSDDDGEAAANEAHATLAQALVDLNTKVDRLHAIPPVVAVEVDGGAGGDGGDGEAGTLGVDDLLPRPVPLDVSASQTGRAIPNTASLDLSLRQLIQLTFDDWTTLKLFELMSESDPDSFGQNKVLYAGVMNVSIQPGRRTYEEHVGEIDVRGKADEAWKTIASLGAKGALAERFRAVKPEVDGVLELHVKRYSRKTISLPVTVVEGRIVLSVGDQGLKLSAGAIAALKPAEAEVPKWKGRLSLRAKGPGPQDQSLLGEVLIEIVK